jgi:hypothetical protein
LIVKVVKVVKVVRRDGLKGPLNPNKKKEEITIKGVIFFFFLYFNFLKKRRQKILATNIFIYFLKFYILNFSIPIHIVPQ